MLKISQKVAKKYVAPKIKMLLKSYPPDAKIFALLFIFSSRSCWLTCQKPFFVVPSAFNPSLLKRVADTLRSVVPRTFFTTSGVGFYFSCRGMSTLIWYGGSSTPPFWIYQPTADHLNCLLKSKAYQCGKRPTMFFSMCEEMFRKLTLCDCFDQIKKQKSASKVFQFHFASLVCYNF